MKAPENTIKSVSILSLNLYCLPAVASAFSPSSCPLPAERSTAFLKTQLPNYDIVALQEVWDPRFKMVEKHALQKGFHVVGSSRPSPLRCLALRVFGGGLMIVSKHPIVDTQEIVYDMGSQSDRFVTKGALYAKIEVAPGAYVHVFNTHLQASYGYEFDFVNNPYTPMRNKQLKKLAAFIEKVTSKDSFPIMVMGDFNVNARAGPLDGSDSKEYKDMIEILRSRSYQIVDVLKECSGGMHPITYGGQGVLSNEKRKIGGQRLDFVLDFKKDSSVHNFGYRLTEGKVVQFETTGELFTHISDHYGQTAQLEIFSTSAMEATSPSTLSTVSISLAVA